MYRLNVFESLICIYICAFNFARTVEAQPPSFTVSSPSQCFRPPITHSALLFFLSVFTHSHFYSFHKNNNSSYYQSRLILRDFLKKILSRAGDIWDADPDHYLYFNPSSTISGLLCSRPTYILFPESTFSLVRTLERAYP